VIQSTQVTQLGIAFRKFGAGFHYQRDCFVAALLSNDRAEQYHCERSEVICWDKNVRADLRKPVLRNSLSLQSSVFDPVQSPTSVTAYRRQPGNGPDVPVNLLRTVYQYKIKIFQISFRRPCGKPF